MFAPLVVALALFAPPQPALCAAPAAACLPDEDAELRARLAPLLGSIDRPIADEAWKRLPSRALPVLERLAADPLAFPARRARALEGAALLGSDGAVHRRLAADAGTSYAVRASAIRGLARLLPVNQAPLELEPLLFADPDPRVRATAADALTRASPARGCAALRAQVARERHGDRPAFRRAIAFCEGR